MTGDDDAGSLPTRRQSCTNVALRRLPPPLPTSAVPTFSTAAPVYPPRPLRSGAQLAKKTKRLAPGRGDPAERVVALGVGHGQRDRPGDVVVLGALERGTPPIPAQPEVPQDRISLGKPQVARIDVVGCRGGEHVICGGKLDAEQLAQLISH